jgi:Concanavalin A-like lectin/glucanases superfamily/FG-GAP-like repeat
MKIQTPAPLLAAFFAAAILATPTHAVVTNVVWYRLGENDPGAASGVIATNTANLLGFNSLKPIGSPRYTNAVSPGAANGLGSSLAVHFSGTNQCLTNALVSTAINNFGLEAWVKPKTTNAGAYYIAQNGFLYFGGWAIAQFGNSYAALLEATPLNFTVGDGSALASPGVWAHLALVRNNGTNRFFLNGVANGPATTDAPLQPFGNFTIGGNFTTNFAGGTTSNSFFNGIIDEVRVFTFAPGQFSTNDLLFNVQRVATLPATDINPPNATLNGSAHPVGFPTTAWFEWGTTTNFGNVTPPQSFGSGTGATNFSEVITGIVLGITYHFRAVASNSLGVAFGTNQSFVFPVFADIAAGLTGVDRGSVAWGDWDNDGRLDILLTGQPLTNSSGDFVSELWQNNGTGFTQAVFGLPGGFESSVAWGDYNNDDRLDFLFAGRFTDLPVVLRPGSTLVVSNFFDVIGFGSLGVFQASVAWGDYDNDGRLDTLLTGATEFVIAAESPATQIWRNTGNGFTFINAGLPAVFQSSVAWADYDNDGRLDFLITGRTNKAVLSAVAISQIWRNTGTGFTNINAGLPGVFQSSAAWGDYDNDGRLDILLAGATQGFIPTNPICQVWRNTGTGFTNINAGLPGVFQSSAAWGDYDNDGRLDILLTGTTNGSGTGAVAQIWRNTGTGFTNINAGLPGVFTSSSPWGDYDNDGRLDILITGTNATSGRISQVWRNRTSVTNTPPTAPTGLSVAHVGNTVILSWNASSDAQTPASGLTYNVRIGTTPGGSDVMGPMASASGLRRLPQMGNAQERLLAYFEAATLGQPYYWSVQAVDSALAGSPFAAESNFKFLQLPQPAPVLVSATTTNLLNGDLNGDGVFDENELQALLADFFASSPFLQMTNVAGLGGTNVTFSLTNSLVGAFSVEFTTNLVDWYFLGPATPRYLFTDTNAPAVPQRFYRLRWP